MVVGLGNPGAEYAETRHNLGFKVIESLAEALRIDLKKKKFGAVFGEGGFADKKLILLKPWQFMNLSGQVVATATGFYRLTPSNVLIVTDDLAIEPGRIRLRTKGSSGGHKGLADIIEKLGTEDICRLRIGIGQSDRIAAVDYVLGKPAENEKSVLDEVVVKAREAVLCWLEYGIEAAMNEFNN